MSKFLTNIKKFLIINYCLFWKINSKMNINKLSKMRIIKVVPFKGYLLSKDLLISSENKLKSIWSVTLNSIWILLKEDFLMMPKSNEINTYRSIKNCKKFMISKEVIIIISWQNFMPRFKNKLSKIFKKKKN